MPVKWWRQTPKGILVIAVPWLTLSGCLIFSLTNCLLQDPQSCDLNPHLRVLPWTWELFVPLVEFVSAFALLLLSIAGPVLLAVGLLRSKRKAIDAARYLSLFWILLLIVSFGLSLEDRYARTDLKDWCFLAFLVVCNLWCWWYLSRARLEDKLRKEQIFLNLNNDRSES